MQERTSFLKSCDSWNLGNWTYFPKSNCPWQQFLSDPSLSLFRSTSFYFYIFFLPCSPEEGSDRPALLGNRCPARLNPRVQVRNQTLESSRISNELLAPWVTRTPMVEKKNKKSRASEKPGQTRSEKQKKNHMELRNHLSSTKRTISHGHLVAALIQLEIIGTTVITLYLQLPSFIPNDLKQLHLFQNFHRNKNRSKPAAINGNASKSTRGLWIRLIFHSKHSPLLYQIQEYTFWLTYKADLQSRLELS